MKNRLKKFLSQTKDRRDALLIGLGAGALLGGGASFFGREAKDKFTLHLHDKGSRRTFDIFLPWQEKFPGGGRTALSFQKRVYDLSYGQMVIQYHDYTATPIDEMKKKLLAGEAHGIYALPEFWQKELPANLLFSAQPFGPNFLEFHQWLASEGEALWRKLHKKIDFYPFAAGVSVGQMGGWFPDEILSMQDLAEVKLAARGLPALLYRQAGLKVYEYHDHEIFSRLQEGLVDGAIVGDPHYDEACGFYKVLKHYFAPAFQAPMQLYQFSLSSSRWQELSEADQTVLQTAAAAEIYESAHIHEQRNRMAIRRMVREQDVLLRIFPNSLTTQMVGHWREVVKTQSAGNKDFANIYQKMRLFVKDNYRWEQRSRNFYQNMRHRLFFSENSPFRY